MVKHLSQQDRDNLQEVLAKAEHATSAIIRVVIVRASDTYRDFVMMLGLMTGSLVALALWACGLVHHFPELLVLQIAIMALSAKIPFVRHGSAYVVPRRMAHKHACRLAYEEYHAYHANLGKDQAFILLFVSLAERYVHVITNPSVHDKIPAGWDKVTDHFAQSMRQKGLAMAAIKAVEDIEALLVNSFPAPSA